MSVGHQNNPKNPETKAPVNGDGECSWLLSILDGAIVLRRFRDLTRASKQGVVRSL